MSIPVRKATHQWTGRKGLPWEMIPNPISEEDWLILYPENDPMWFEEIAEFKENAGPLEDTGTSGNLSLDDPGYGGPAYNIPDYMTYTSGENQLYSDSVSPHDVLGVSDFTIGARLKFNTQAKFIMQGTASVSHSGRWYFGADGGKATWQTRIGAYPSGGGSSDSVEGPPVPTGSFIWMFIRKSGNVATFYVQGEEPASRVIVHPDADISRLQFASDLPVFEGTVLATYIWSNASISEREIYKLMEIDNPIDVSLNGWSYSLGPRSPTQYVLGVGQDDPPPTTPPITREAKERSVKITWTSSPNEEYQVLSSPDPITGANFGEPEEVVTSETADYSWEVPMVPGDVRFFAVRRFVRIGVRGTLYAGDISNVIQSSTRVPPRDDIIDMVPPRHQWLMEDLLDTGSGTQASLVETKTYIDKDYLISGARRFDGVTSHVEIPTIDTEELLGTSAFSIGIWFFPRAVGTQQYLLHSYRNGDANPVRLTVRIEASGTITTQWMGFANVITTNTTAGTVVQDRWNFFMVTFDGTKGADTTKMYLNSLIPELAESNEKDLDGPNDLITVGAFYNGTTTRDRYFNGDFEVIWTYDRELPLNEVAMLFQGGTPSVKDATVGGSFPVRARLLDPYLVSK